jgi:hypothetical protein
MDFLIGILKVVLWVLVPIGVVFLYLSYIHPIIDDYLGIDELSDNFNLKLKKFGKYLTSNKKVLNVVKVIITIILIYFSQIFVIDEFNHVLFNLSRIDGFGILLSSLIIFANAFTILLVPFLFSPHLYFSYWLFSIVFLVRVCIKYSNNSLDLYPEIITAVTTISTLYIIMHKSKKPKRQNNGLH